MATTKNSTTTKQDTTHRRRRANNGDPIGLRARGRRLISGAVSPIICSGNGSRRTWLSTTKRPIDSVVRLLSLLDHHDRIYFSPRREMCHFPPPEPLPQEEKLRVRRWRMVGTAGFLADRRRARLQTRVANSARTNGTTSPGSAPNALRRVRGARRVATMTGEAA